MNKTTYLRCSDKCATLFVEQSEDHEIICFEIENSNLVGKSKFKQKIRKAIGVLLGKSVPYAEICVTDNEEVKRFIKELSEMVIYD